jgi:hypothetical protein
MSRFALFLVAVLWLTSSQALLATAPSSNWYDRAPLNTDTDFVGLPWYGLGRAYRYLAFILNLAVLAGLSYWLGKNEVEWSNFFYVYFGILVGSILLSVLFSPLLHVFSIIPIVVLATFLLARFCLLRPARALAVTLLYQLYQVGYLILYNAIAARYA